MPAEIPHRITEVTRRAIFDRLTVEEYPWHGRLDPVEFLSRLYNLTEIPSTDGRFEDASGDIWQHTVNNPSDWSYGWVFQDQRFEILRGPDEVFLKFICEMAHPVVSPDTGEADRLVSFFNSHLSVDGWEITEATRISNKPVYAARPLLDGAGVSIAAAKELAAVLNADYVNQQITRMETAIDRDPELAIGTAKEFIETICKTILTEQHVSFRQGRIIAQACEARSW